MGHFTSHMKVTYLFLLGKCQAYLEWHIYINEENIHQKKRPGGETEWEGGGGGVRPVGGVPAKKQAPH